MKIDLDDLERKARAATPGPWITWDAPEDGEVYDDLVHKRVVQVSRHPVAANVEHIAANSPPVTLALIDRIRELEAGASGNDCRAPGAQPCECCIARGGYQ